MARAVTFETMGTVVSVRGVADTSGIEEVFRAAEARFSLYEPTSELSRVARGELELARASSELRDAYARAIEWRSATGGAFTAHRPDGVIDLNGIVKAIALEQCAGLLPTGEWLINCGGDMVSRGDWAVGVIDPDDASRLLCSVRLGGDRRAIATSGVAERGDHIWGSRPGFRQVTVIASDIVTADVLATAIVAGGEDTLDLATREWPVHVLAVSADGLVATPGFREALSGGEDDETPSGGS